MSTLTDVEVWQQKCELGDDCTYEAEDCQWDQNDVQAVNQVFFFNKKGTRLFARGLAMFLAHLGLVNDPYLAEAQSPEHIREENHRSAEPYLKLGHLTRNPDCGSQAAAFLRLIQVQPVVPIVAADYLVREQKHKIKQVPDCRDVDQAN